MRKFHRTKKGGVKLIGVTGSFCTGKTTVCDFFRRKGARIIDADKIVHELYRRDKNTKRDLSEQ